MHVSQHRMRGFFAFNHENNVFGGKQHLLLEKMLKKQKNKVEKINKKQEKQSD